LFGSTARFSRSSKLPRERELHLRLLRSDVTTLAAARTPSPRSTRLSPGGTRPFGAPNSCSPAYAEAISAVPRPGAHTDARQTGVLEHCHWIKLSATHLPPDAVLFAFTANGDVKGANSSSSESRTQVLHAVRLAPTGGAGPPAAPPLQRVADNWISSSRVWSGLTPAAFTRSSPSVSMVYGIRKLLTSRTAHILHIGAFIGYGLITVFVGPTQNSHHVILLLTPEWVPIAMARGGPRRRDVRGPLPTAGCATPLAIAPLITALGVSSFSQNGAQLVSAGAPVPEPMTPSSGRTHRSRLRTSASAHANVSYAQIIASSSVTVPC